MNKKSEKESGEYITYAYNGQIKRKNKHNAITHAHTHTYLRNIIIVINDNQMTNVSFNLPKRGGGGKLLAKKKKQQRIYIYISKIITVSCFLFIQKKEILLIVF